MLNFLNLLAAMILQNLLVSIYSSPTNIQITSTIVIEKMIPLFDSEASTERVPQALALAPDDSTDASGSSRTLELPLTPEV